METPSAFSGPRPGSLAPPAEPTGRRFAFPDAGAQFRAAREATAIYDASSLGRIRATGADVLDLLNRLSTNKVDHLAPGQGAPTILTNEKGRVIDLVRVFNCGGYVLMLTSAGAEAKVAEWVDKYTIMEDSVLESLASSTALITVAGPEARGSLEALSGASLKDVGTCQCERLSIDGLDVLVMRMDLGDLPSWQLMLPSEGAEQTWDALVEAGVVPVDAGAQEALRIDAGIPLYGREMGDGVNPLEAGLIGAIDFAKGCYIGQEVIARLDTYDKVQRALARLELFVDGQWQEGDGRWQEGVELVWDGRAVGRLTSFARLPGSDRSVGLALIRTSAAEVGNRLTLAGSGQAYAEVTAIPRLFGP